MQSDHLHAGHRPANSVDDLFDLTMTVLIFAYYDDMVIGAANLDIAYPYLMKLFHTIHVFQICHIALTIPNLGFSLLLQKMLLQFD